MKNIFFAVFALLILASCSTESDSNNDFFNLRDGNFWVYKRFYSNSDGSSSGYAPGNDTVRVTGDTLINSIRYSKLVHKGYGDYLGTECLRVDGNGHLVNQNGVVCHPGTDFEYHSVRDVFTGGGSVNIGSVTEHLLEPFTTNIEGTDYFVYSYYGDYTPLDPAIPNNYIFSQYKEGVGFVCLHCAAAAGGSYTEDRLVYYRLN